KRLSKGGQPLVVDELLNEDVEYRAVHDGRRNRPVPRLVIVLTRSCPASLTHSRERTATALRRSRQDGLGRPRSPPDDPGLQARRRLGRRRGWVARSRRDRLQPAAVTPGD